MSRILSVIGVVYLLVAPGCQKDGDTFDKGSGEVQQKPATGPQGASASQGGDSKPVVTSEYDVFVRTRSGTTLCKGHTKVLITSSFAMNFGDGTLKCLSINLDLKKLLGSATAAQSHDGAPTQNKLSSDGKVLRASQLGQFSYEPARPFLVGPVIQDPKLFQGLFEEKQYVVKGTQPAAQSTGSIRLQVEGIDETLKPEGYKGNINFNHIMRWKMETTGFNEINRASAILFDSIEFFWNTIPIAVPKILVEADLNDLMQGNVLGGDLGGLGGILSGGLIGKLTIELSLTSHESL